MSTDTTRDALAELLAVQDMIGTIRQRAAVNAALAAQPAQALTDEEIAQLGEDHGLCTRVMDAGYPCDMLWFDSTLTEFARAVERVHGIGGKP